MRIFNRYVSIYDFILLLGDITVAILATAAVRAVIEFANPAGTPHWLHWLFQGLAVAIIVVVSFYYCDLYAIDQTLSVRELLLRLMTGIGSSCILIGIVSYPIPQLGKTIYASEMVLMVLGLYAWRVGFMRVLQRARIHSRVLIIGIQEIGKLVAEELLKQKKLGMKVIGFIGRDSGTMTLSYGNPTRVSLPIFQPGSLMALHNEHNINRILLAGNEPRKQEFAHELLLLRTRGLPVEDCHSFYERLVSKIAVGGLAPEWFMRSEGFRRDWVVVFAKRFVDLVVASLGLLLTAPITLIAALAIKLDSRGPVLYRQERVGYKDKIFTIYKFRSMCENAETNGCPLWAAENDPRVTRVGKFLRKVRIDEIPQMINVLKGDMSFVGPRPERPYFVNSLVRTIPYYELRHSVKPGITGWAQISYQYSDSEHGAMEKLQYDLYYIKHMSILFDLQIIFETLKVVLFGNGAR
jgi:sugar transferase (PEP-CTERM system associated)